MSFIRLVTGTLALAIVALLSCLAFSWWWAGLITAVAAIIYARIEPSIFGDIFPPDPPFGGTPI